MNRWLGLAALSISIGATAAGCSDEAACVEGSCDPHAPDAASPAPAENALPRVLAYDAACGSNVAYWPEELDDIRWSVRCSSALVGATGLPEGATFDPVAGTIAWKPRVDQAGPFEILVSSADGAVTRIAGTALDRFDAPGNVPLVDRARYLEEHGLPVIHLSWHSAEPGYCKDAVRRDPVPADIIVGGVAHVGAELRCRGQTSLSYPQKGFTLRFAKEDPFHAPPGLAAFEGRRRLILTQTFDDNSHVRNRMAFELWNRLDPANIRIDHASVVVFVDGAYQGLYQLTDDIGDHLMAARGLDKDGAIFKSESHDGNYKATLPGGAPKTDLKIGYEKSAGEPEDDFKELESLLRWVTDSSAEVIESTIDTRLRTEDFLDWYILTNTLLAYDNWGKNSTVYIDPDGPDARFRYMPWDLNATLGQTWDRQRIPPTSAGKDSPLPLRSNGIWERIAASPVLKKRLDDRYAAALAGPMSLATTLAVFDRMSDEVRASGPRDDRRWDAERHAYRLWTAHAEKTTSDAERAFVRAWIQQRWEYLSPLYGAPR